MWACLHKPLRLPPGRSTHRNSCHGIGSVANSQLLLSTRHKLPRLPTRSGQYYTGLPRQTVSAHGAGVAPGLDSRISGSARNRSWVQSSPAALSGSPTWSPADDLFMERGRDFLLANWRETHFQASRAAHLTYSFVIEEEGRVQTQLLSSFNVNKIKWF